MADHDIAETVPNQMHRFGPLQIFHDPFQGGGMLKTIDLTTGQVQTLLDVPDLTSARQRLAKREGIAKRWETDIGYWDCGGNAGAGREAATIAAWAAANGLAAVVWTNLPCKFDGKDTKPTGEQVVAFLRDLDDDKRPLAEAYVRQAPAAIDTPYRRMIAEQLGWHHRS